MAQANDPEDNLQENSNSPLLSRNVKSSNFTLLSTLTNNNILEVMKLSCDGKLLAGATHDASLKIWDVYSTNLQKTLHGHTGEVLDLSWSSDNTLLASISIDNTLRIWDVTSGKCLRVLNQQGLFRCNFNPSSSMIAAGLIRGVIHIWDVKTGILIKHLQKLNGLVTAVSFNEDGTFLINSTSAGTWHIWDVADERCLITRASYLENPISSAYFSPNDNYIMILTNIGMLQLWKFFKSITGICPFKLYSINTFPAVFFSNGHTWITDISQDVQELYVWDTETETNIQKLKLYIDEIITCAAFHPTAHMIALSGDNGLIKIWKNNSN